LVQPEAFSNNSFGEISIGCSFKVFFGNSQAKTRRLPTIRPTQ
jgi:hypothetical protein